MEFLPVQDEGRSGGQEPPAILIVNDNPAQLAAMEAILGATGYRVARATSGRDALLRLLAEDFAVIVLDVRMPGLDGFETARLVRQRLRSEQTPIVFATSEAMSPEDARRGYAIGAVDYLVAPFDAATLRAKVAVFVELFRRTEDARALNQELLREVEERRRTEAALATKAAALQTAIQELEAYDYSVAHDLRAPIRAIRGYATMLAEDSAAVLSEEARDHVDRILRAGDHMSQLIEGLLELSRAGRAPMHRATIDVTTIADEIVSGLRRSAPERRFEATVERGMSARADPALLRVVLQNLLDNAWKFTRARDVTRIEVGTRQQAGDTVFSVRDNGVGFDMRYAGQLFQTFQRLHSGTEFEGTGIGLVTVRRIVARHGGRVWVDAAPDRGALFSFTLPDALPPGVGVPVDSRPDAHATAQGIQ